jgi:hypothetical protein
MATIDTATALPEAQLEGVASLFKVLDEPRAQEKSVAVGVMTMPLGQRCGGVSFSIRWLTGRENNKNGIDALQRRK